MANFFLNAADKTNQDNISSSDHFLASGNVGLLNSHIFRNCPSRFFVEEKLNGWLALIAFIDLFREIDERSAGKFPDHFHGRR
jgi:hypothetical protein